MKLRVVRPGHELMTPVEAVKGLVPLVEAAGRVCYKSEERIAPGSAGKFIRSVVKRGHESVIEHGNVTVKIICDRSCSHQLVRHRIAAYSQESQRYCDYAGKQGVGGLRIICPPSIAPIPAGWYTFSEGRQWLITEEDGTQSKLDRYVEPAALKRARRFLIDVGHAYASYMELREMGVPPEDARSVLPNAVKTEVVTTFNLRQWRHVFMERALNPHAQWQIRKIMLGVLAHFQQLLPEVFGDLEVPA